MAEFNLSKGLSAFAGSIGDSLAATKKREGEIARETAKAELTQTHRLAVEEARAGNARKAAKLANTQANTRANTANDQRQLNADRAFVGQENERVRNLERDKLKSAQRLADTLRQTKNDKSTSDYRMFVKTSTAEERELNKQLRILQQSSITAATNRDIAAIEERKILLAERVKLVEEANKLKEEANKIKGSAANQSRFEQVRSLTAKDATDADGSPIKVDDLDAMRASIEALPEDDPYRKWALEQLGPKPKAPAVNSKTGTPDRADRTGLGPAATARGEGIIPRLIADNAAEFDEIDRKEAEGGPKGGSFVDRGLYNNDAQRVYAGASKERRVELRAELGAAGGKSKPSAPVVATPLTPDQASTVIEFANGKKMTMADAVPALQARINEVARTNPEEARRLISVAKGFGIPESAFSIGE